MGDEKIYSICFECLVVITPQASVKSIGSMMKENSKPLHRIEFNMHMKLENLSKLMFRTWKIQNYSLFLHISEHLLDC